MAVLHITRPGAKVRLRKGRFVVEKDGTVLATAPKHQVERIVLHGSIGLTTPALVFCMRKGIPVYFVSGGGNLYGKAVGISTTSAEKLKAQVLLSEDARLRIARQFLLGKVLSQKEYASLRNKRDPCKASTLPEGLFKADRLLAAASTLEELRGIEGTAAAAYFGVLACGWSRYGFASRNRRPPRDPVNAALSYGYAVLRGVVEAAVVTAGLHPEIGVLHSTTRRNPALVLDLMEEFRVPAVDRTVGRLFGRGELNPKKHFSGGSQKTLLNRGGKAILLEALEAQLQSVRTHPSSGRAATLMEHIYKQANSLEAAIVRGKTYVPFWAGNR